jgi:hypothetical protein
MKWVSIGVLLLAAWIAPCCAHGEVVVLRNGGRIEGTLVNPKEVPRE